MSQLSLRIGALLLGAASALALATAPVNAQAYVASDETEVREMVNATRVSKGLGKLTKNEGLVEMAREQADRMEAKRDIFHTPNLAADVTSAALDWLRIGENVGVGPNIHSIEEAFLASPGHYANIVRPEYNAIGIGVVDGGDGRRYVVQVFANLKNVAAQAPAAVSKLVPAVPKAVAAPEPTVVAPAPAAPTPAPVAATAAPTPGPETADPNALTGGFVNPIELAPSDLGLYPEEAPTSQASGFGRLVDILAFWA
jgi:hypothetical protein